MKHLILFLILTSLSFGQSRLLLLFDDDEGMPITFTGTSTGNITLQGTAVFSNADSTFTVYTSTSAEFKIGALDTYNTNSKTAESGDTVFVRNTSSGSYSTLNREIIIAGGVSRNFDVTTEAEPPPPPPIQGGWIHQANGRKLFFNNGKAVITKEN